ncbi:hypothetical protein PybrP1_011088 [[Pythium] brassicae (nom. inval.)]|nr:hypothetical protein PybrP1_011088 [[Pythium] brassicae (nom. inval.)]
MDVDTVRSFVVAFVFTSVIASMASFTAATAGRRRDRRCGCRHGRVVVAFMAASVVLTSAARARSVSFAKRNACARSASSKRLNPATSTFSSALVVTPMSSLVKASSVKWIDAPRMRINAISLRRICCSELLLLWLALTVEANANTLSYMLMRTKMLFHAGRVSCAMLACHRRVCFDVAQLVQCSAVRESRNTSPRGRLEVFTTSDFSIFSCVECRFKSRTSFRAYSG